VEIVSPSSRRYDRVTKLAWYASIGVPEYWILDPTAHTIERLVLQGDRCLVEQVASEADVFRPASFEELEIPLATLWKLPTSA
jgi:Uma2 family endonuclease